MIIATNIHEEAMADDIYDLLYRYGEVKSFHFNIDKRTGYAKGYVLAEFQ